MPGSPDGALSTRAPLPSIILPNMTAKNQTLGQILRTGFLPNLINDSLDAEKAVEAAAAAGVRAFEISCRRPDTLALLARLKRLFPGVSFGGSSLIEDGPYFRFLQARGPRFPSIDEAADAGADFLVSVLAFSAETFRRHARLPIIPGVESADEARRQLDLGASLVKFSNTDAATLKAINGGPIHFGLPLLATGGIRPARIREFVQARVLVCVSGFDLILRDRLQAMQQDFDEAEVRGCVAEYVEAFSAARRELQPEVDFASADPALIQQQSGQFLNADMAP